MAYRARHPAAPADYGFFAHVNFKGQTYYPEPSDEELALQKQQTELVKLQTDMIREQNEVQSIVADLMFSEQGYNVVRDEEGKLVDILPPETREITESERNEQEIQELFQERTLAALRGELPINPALEGELSNRQSLVHETLRKQLGPGYETSTPGIESLSALSSSDFAIREAARRGDLTLAESLGLAQTESNFARQQAILGNLVGASNLPLQGVSALNSPVGNLSDILGGMQSDRFAEGNISAQNAAARSQRQAGMMGASAAIVSAAIMAAAV